MNPNAAAFAALLQRRQGIVPPLPRPPPPLPPPPNTVFYQQPYGNMHFQQFIEAGRPPPPPMPPPAPPLGHPIAAADPARNVSICQYYNGHVQNGKIAPLYPTVYPAQAQMNYIHNFNGKGVSPPAPRGSMKKIPLVSSETFYCESCDKEFSQKSQYDAHVATHEICRHPGCSFSGSKKVVNAHYHSAHGQYSGSGFKLIDVEGQKFKVLMGMDPSEVQEWRSERRKKFPTHNVVSKKLEAAVFLEEAGGISSTVERKKRPHSDTKFVNPACDGAAESGLPSSSENPSTSSVGDLHPEVDSVSGRTDLQASKKRPCHLFKKSKCNNGDSCKYSHHLTGFPKNQSAPRLCMNFINKRCKFGSKCRYLHDAAAVGDPAKSVQIFDSKSPTRSNDDKEFPPRKKVKKGPLQIPVPLGIEGSKSTLLKTLLLDEVIAEESLVLQCVRYLRYQNFLQDEDSCS